MEDLIGAILGGGTQRPDQPQQSGDPLADLLGGILGGGTSGSGGQPDALGGLLEGILGGGAGTQQGGQAGFGLDDILGILGGGQPKQSAAAGPFAPIIGALAEKLGLDPQLAQIVVTFVVNKLLSGLVARSAGAAAAPGAVPQPAPAGPQGGLDLDHLLEQMSSGRLDTRFLNSSGLTQELVEHTGMDEELAAASLQHTFQMLGAQMPTPEKREPESKGLEDLLDTW